MLLTEQGLPALHVMLLHGMRRVCHYCTAQSHTTSSMLSASVPCSTRGVCVLVNNATRGMHVLADNAEQCAWCLVAQHVGNATHACSGAAVAIGLLKFVYFVAVLAGDLKGANVLLKSTIYSSFGHVSSMGLRSHSWRYCTDNVHPLNLQTRSTKNRLTSSICRQQRLPDESEINQLQSSS
jgi:hypothetical protein